MSSESEKQFFISKETPSKKPEKPSVSPEKEKKAIQYAEEIKRIREKEILTEEDSVRVKELVEKLKRIYSPEIYFESEKAKERLKVLKKTPLWDEKRKQWNESMYENQEFQDSGRFSEAQLLGILAEAVTGNLEGAQERLEELKKTSLWDRERKQWSLYMSENQELRNSFRDSHNQLLGVIVEAVAGNSEEVKEKLEKLKETPLWDRKRKQWNWFMSQNQELMGLERRSHDQLLGVIAEAVTGNLEGAQERLEELKKTPLWDRKRKQWKGRMDEDQKLRESSRFSEAQLLGILAEAVTGNSEEAKKRLEKLKETSLWDRERKQWYWYMNENQEIESSIRLSHDQLLGVLVEAFYEKEGEFVEWLIKEK